MNGTGASAKLSPETAPTAFTGYVMYVCTMYVCMYAGTKISK